MASDIEHQIPTLEMDHDENPDVIPSSCLAAFIYDIIKLKVLGTVLRFLLSPLLAVVMLSSCATETKEVPSSAEGIAGIYKESRRRDTLALRIRWGTVEVLGAASLLLSVWLTLNLRVPRLKRLTLMGSPLWRWSLLTLTIVAGFSVAMLTYLAFSSMLVSIIAMLTLPPSERKHSVKEYIYFNFLPSTSFLIYFGMILVSWLVYFRTEHGLKNDSYPHPEAFQHVTWTCVSLFVGSVLWHLKDLLLSKWSAKAIYGRFEPRILITGVKFFYLGIITRAFIQKKFIKKLKVFEEFARHSDPTRFNLTNYIMSRKLDMTSLKGIGQSLMDLEILLRLQEKDGVPLVMDFLQTKIPSTCQRCDLDILIELLSCTGNLFPSADYRKQTASVLHCIVREQCADDFTFDDLKNWMVDAHKSCVNMGHTLADANAIVTRLDIFLSSIVVTAVVLLWLLITGVANTQVIVTIATPMLALTYIFGDSAKTFFQGIIFCVATHPFDVGDRCILDETELEVKSISILTTTFIKIGTTEKRMYPNSVLASKAIVNLGWQPDPTDVVELTLDFSTSPTKLRTLEDKLKQFFRIPEHGKYLDTKYEVMMKEIGEKIKVTVYFKHVLDITEMTHGQCLQKKNRQRSKFLKIIYCFLDSNISPAELEIKDMFTDQSEE